MHNIALCHTTYLQLIGRLPEAARALEGPAGGGGHAATVVSVARSWEPGTCGRAPSSMLCSCCQPGLMKIRVAVLGLNGSMRVKMTRCPATCRRTTWRASPAAPCACL